MEQNDCRPTSRDIISNGRVVRTDNFHGQIIEVGEGIAVLGVPLIDSLRVGRLLSACGRLRLQ